MKQEVFILNKERNVTLTTYLQDTSEEFERISKRPAVLILPGGGYRFCSDREADPVACTYMSAGYQAFVLRYSVGEYAIWPNPLEDYEQAMGMIRDKAEEWGIYPDKIAVVGFSAGGHLAACAATMAENKPNGAILVYAVTGKEMVACCMEAPAPSEFVDCYTSPCFVAASRTDSVVPVENSLNFMNELYKKGISFESHIYAFGEHGFSVGDASLIEPRQYYSRIRNWCKDSIAWLEDLFGSFEKGHMSKPLLDTRIRGDADEYLSVDCTLGKILGNGQAQEVFKAAFAGNGAMMEGVNMQMGAGNTAFSAPSAEMMQHITVRQALRFAQLSEEQIEQMDQELQKIRNE